MASHRRAMPAAASRGSRAAKPSGHHADVAAHRYCPLIHVPVGRARTTRPSKPSMSNTREWAATTRRGRAAADRQRDVQRGQPQADLPGRERPLGRQEREDLRGRRRQPLLGPGDAALGEHGERQASLDPGHVDRRGVVGQRPRPRARGPTACGASRGGGSGSARRRARARRPPTTAWPCARPPTGRPTPGRWSAARRARRRWPRRRRCAWPRRAGGGRPAGRGARRCRRTGWPRARACQPAPDKTSAPRPRSSRAAWSCGRRDHPVTMQVIVPGATSVNPASRTATASPASTARHSCGQPRPGVAHGERGHRDQPVRRRVQHRRVPDLRRRLADRHLQRRVDVDHRHAGRRAARGRPARGRCRRSAAGRRPWARRPPARAAARGPARRRRSP